MANSYSVVTIPIHHPVIISNGMVLQDWKKHFVLLLNEAKEVADKVRYNKCLKLLMLAELCNCTQVRVGNSKESYGLAVNFHLDFPNSDCMEVFSKNLAFLDVISKVI